MQQAEQQHLAETLQDVAVRMEGAELRAENRAVQIERLDAEGTPLAEEETGARRAPSRARHGGARSWRPPSSLLARQEAVDARIEEARIARRRRSRARGAAGRWVCCAS